MKPQIVRQGQGEAAEAARRLPKLHVMVMAEVVLVWKGHDIGGIGAGLFLLR